jgi:hypothetical protein
MMINLYDRDYYEWFQETSKQLKEKRFEMVDWDNLIEELEDMGRSEKRAVESLLLRLLEHLFKLKYWESERERSANHWIGEIANFRVLLKKRLKDSPSLKAKLEEIYDDVYPDSKKVVANLFDLPQDAEITLTQAMDEEWFPN